MTTVRFTANIQRHVACPPMEVEAATVREALEAYFRANARARSYVLDDQGRLRKHMATFVNGSQTQHADHLSDALPEGAVVDVIQSLSGG
jgi:molybdopterin converting factor small subunit